MTGQVNVASFNWAPYGAGQIAQVNLVPPATDTNFVVPIVAQFNNAPLYADGVIVENSQGETAVTVTVGNLTANINPFQRDFVTLGSNVGGSVTVNASSPCSLLFYKGVPPIAAQVPNYAGSAGLLANLFTSATPTTGTANAQLATVATNYAFANGVLLSLTAGNTNTGPTTIAINGGPAVAIYKTTDAGGRVELAGGEIVAGSNFVLSANGAAGNYDLVSRSGLAYAAAPTNLVVFYSSGTYNPSAGCKWAKVRVWGAGGGGAGNGSGAGNGGTGGASSYGAQIVATGGGAGQTNGAATAGGAGTVGTILSGGADGAPGGGNVSGIGGGMGGAAPFYGVFGFGGPAAISGGNAIPHSGGGGGGAGYFSGSAQPSGGGGGGGYAEGYVVGPVATTITVGAGGAPGPAGAGGGAGGAGGSGMVIIEEYFAQVQ